jgi:hypothetical protein
MILTISISMMMMRRIGLCGQYCLETMVLHFCRMKSVSCLNFLVRAELNSVRILKNSVPVLLESSGGK